MNTMLANSIITGVLFFFMFAFGYMLSRGGKPYSTILFNVHKLIGLGLGVFLILTLTRMHKATPFSSVEIATLVVAALLFVVTIVAGGLLDALEAAPEALIIVHHWLPYFSAASAAASLYLVFTARL